MEELNRTLFLLINASGHPNGLMIAIAGFLAEYVIWTIPAIVGIGWLRGSERTRKVLLEATVSGLTGLLINQIIGLAWQHPRPFMIGLGHTFIPHAADSSFPSDHLTLIWAVAASFLMHRSSRMMGLALALLGIPVAWARIYLGFIFLSTWWEPPWWRHSAPGWHSARQGGSWGQSTALRSTFIDGFWVG